MGKPLHLNPKKSIFSRERLGKGVAGLNVALSRGAVLEARKRKAPGEVRAATIAVAKGLQKDVIAKNHSVIAFLKHHKYVIVDGAGKITGTNVPRVLGIGRIRLESKKILNQKYE